MKFDLHIHTKYSLDGKEEPYKIAKFLKKAGYGGMAITDHDTIKGADISIDDFIVIPGEEIKTDGGHILAIGIKEEIKSRIASDAIDEIHDKGGIAIIAHPFRFSKPKVEKIDAVEVINGRNFPTQNKKARQYALRRRLPMTAGSDAHFIWECGRAYTLIDAESTDDAIEAILKGETKELAQLSDFITLLKARFIHLPIL
ncbi:MAG: PHP domain-containing protein [Thermoplasmata archaeon]|nr:MAG: PHP domain-containing protein [Thermoplasmata archaeon]